MESFFLSETAKYLFLLGANATGLPDFYVLTTEGHLLPPLPASAAAGAGLGSGGPMSTDRLYGVACRLAASPNFAVAQELHTLSSPVLMQGQSRTWLAAVTTAKGLTTAPV